MTSHSTHTLGVLALLGIILLIAIAQPAFAAPTITIVTPQPNTVVTTDQPTIKVTYSSDVEIPPNWVILTIDGHVIGFGITQTTTSLTFVPIKEYHLINGIHNVTVSLTDNNQKTANVTWSFTVNATTAVIPPINPLVIITYVLIGSLIFVVAFAIVILYLKATRKFTFKKYFARHPVKNEVKYIYIPVIIGFFVTIFTLLVVVSIPHKPSYAIEYVLIAGFFIGITPYTVFSQRERRRTAKYERAFAQFLFEMADSIRGGLDPLKAITELATTHTGVLKPALKKASENIKMGRPFEEVMNNLSKNINSDLVRRYATLIGDTSKVGGEIGIVIYRAAKDMDDFIKISQERRRQLSGQTFVLYIGFGVVLAIIYLLINIFPSMGSINISLLSSTSVTNIKNQAVVSRITEDLMKQRFFHMMLIFSVGTGTVIGSFVDGKFQYGLIHSIILTAATAVFFGLFIA